MAMKYVNYLDFSLSQINLFLTLAETLSYTKTAELCHTTQPTVTKNIKAMENALGILLFVRKTSFVTLTPAGRDLAQSLRGYSQIFSSAVSRAAEIQEGLVEKLVISMPPFISFCEILNPFLDEYISCNPNVDVELVFAETDKALSQIARGEHDIAFGYFGLMKPLISPLDVDLIYENVCMVPQVAYMRPNNPLAEKERLQYSDLRNQKFIVLAPGSFNGDSSQAYYNTLFLQDGWRPTYTRYARSNAEAFGNILHDNDIFLGCPLNSGRFFPHVVGRPLGEELYAFQVAWKKESQGVVASFVDAFCEYLMNKPLELESLSQY